MINVKIWNEYGDAQKRDVVKKIYPDGIHCTLKSFLEKNGDFKVSTAILDEPEHGLTINALENTDVLLWWGHCYHGDVDDRIVERVIEAVHKGMGIIFLHSAHKSKPFMRLLGTTGNLNWREANERERIWTVNPSHKIALNLPEQFTLEHEEMYGEPFDIPEPESTVFIGWFKGGNVFRSGVTYRRGYGKIFYFQPGHETNESFYDSNVQKIITNAIRWAAPTTKSDVLTCNHHGIPLEKI